MEAAGRTGRKVFDLMSSLDRAEIDALNEVSRRRISGWYLRLSNVVARTGGSSMASPELGWRRGRSSTCLKPDGRVGNTDSVLSIAMWK